MSTRKIVAELVGTFMFLVLGYLSVAGFHATSTPTPGLLVVPFAFGLGLLAALYTFGHISGGHFNPAVTVAMVLDRRTTPIDAVGYIAAQVVGALLAALVVMLAVSQEAVTQGITAPGTGVPDTGALLIEIVATAIFIAVILTSTKRSPSPAYLAIAFTLVAIHFGIAALTGSSVNPARSLGSAIVGGDLSKIWIYVVGPVVGGILGWVVWRGVDGGAEEPAS